MKDLLNATLLNNKCHDRCNMTDRSVGRKTSTPSHCWPRDNHVIITPLIETWRR